MILEVVGVKIIIIENISLLIRANGNGIVLSFEIDIDDKQIIHVKLELTRYHICILDVQYIRERCLKERVL